MFFDWKTQFIAKNYVYRAKNIVFWYKYHTSSVDKLCLSQKNYVFQSKNSLLVDKQCLSNWEAEFFDKLCFSIEKYSLLVNIQCLSNRKAEFCVFLCFSSKKQCFLIEKHCWLSVINSVLRFITHLACHSCRLHATKYSSYSFLC